MKRRIYEILNPSPGVADPAAVVVNQFLVWLIVVNVAALVLETVDAIHALAPGLFLGVERFCVVVFTIEYILRLWVCTEEQSLRDSIWPRARYAIRPLPVLDLLAILPAFIPIGADLRALRIARLLRMLRIAKLGRYSKSLQLLGRVIHKRRAELMTTVGMMLLLLLMASSLMYFAERAAQPDVFSSIPAAMWWGVATLTTVGYGDVYPITPVGKLLGAFVAMMGVGLFALPTGLLGAAFAEELQSEPKPPCPHCGKRAQSPTGGAPSGDG